MLPSHVSSKCNIQNWPRCDLLWKGLAWFSSSSAQTDLFWSKSLRFAPKEVVNLRSQKMLVLSVTSLFMFGAILVHEGEMVLIAGVSVRYLPGGLSEGR